MAAPQSVHDGDQVAKLDPRGVRFVGYLPGPAPDGLDCESPLSVVRNDGSRDVWVCSNHRQSKCRPCAARYGRRVRSLARAGLYRRDGFYYHLTLTAPSDVHYYDKAQQRECPCGVRGFDLAKWNPTASTCWNRLLTKIERKYGRRPEYFRGVEVQDRGALHYHVIVWSPVALGDAKSLRPLVIDAGFGHSLTLDQVDAGSKAVAGYVSKYVTKSCDTREAVPWWGQIIDYSTGEVIEGDKPATYRTWSQSQGFGTTMAEVRRQAQQKAAELDQLRSLARENAPGRPDQPAPDETPSPPE